MAAWRHHPELITLIIVRLADNALCLPHHLILPEEAQVSLCLTLKIWEQTLTMPKRLFLFLMDNPSNKKIKENVKKTSDERTIEVA